MDINKVYKEVCSIEAMIDIAMEHGNLDGHIADVLKIVAKELREYLYDKLSEYYN